MHVNILVRCRQKFWYQARENYRYMQAVLSKVDDFATFKKVEVHAKNSTF